MDTLHLLGVALGLATLAGVNLYLTVFLTGLALNLGWIELAPDYEKLAILADPTIITVSGIMFAIEFFADKVPWLDSMWDSVHTLIRPVGGALLSLQVLGTSNPVFDVIVALLSGGISLGVHGIKAGTRLIVNTSPEPFSNVALSVTEDTAVAGGVALTFLNPVAMFFIVVCLVTTAIWGVPRLFAFFAVRLRFVWNKIVAPPGAATPDLTHHFPSRADLRLAEALLKENLPPAKVQWVLSCFAERLPGQRRNSEGYLACLENCRYPLVFIPKSRSSQTVFIDLETYKVCQESSFLVERLLIYSLSKKSRYSFSAFRWQEPQIRKALELLSQKANGATEDAHNQEPSSSTPPGSQLIVAENKQLAAVHGCFD